MKLRKVYEWTEEHSRCSAPKVRPWRSRERWEIGPSAASGGADSDFACRGPSSSRAVSGWTGRTFRLAAATPGSESAVERKVQRAVSSCKSNFATLKITELPEHLTTQNLLQNREPIDFDDVTERSEEAKCQQEIKILLLKMVEDKM